jgi:hypothetical protein
MSDAPHVTTVSEARLLSVTTGLVEGSFRLLLSLRLDPESSFAATTYALSGEEAARLYRDLAFLCHYHAPMAATLEAHPSMYAFYERIILDQSPEPQMP